MARKVAIIVTTRNRAELLKRLLQNIFSQTLQPNEVIVVDDASIDHTPQVVKDFNVSYIRLKERKGASKARNIGINASKSELIAIVDDDIILDCRWLEELVRGLEKMNGKNIAGIRGVILPASKHSFNPLIAHYDLRQSTVKIPIMELSIESCLIKRSALINCGLYDPTLMYGHEVLDLAIRLQKAGFKEVLYTPYAVAYHDYARNLWAFLRKIFIMGFTCPYLDKKHKIRLSFRGKACTLSAIFFAFLITAFPLYLLYNLTHLFPASFMIPALLFLYALVKYKSIPVALIYVLQNFVRFLGIISGKSCLMLGGKEKWKSILRGLCH